MSKKNKQSSSFKQRSQTADNERSAKNDDIEHSGDFLERSDVYLSAATAAVLLALYTATLYPSVPGGDSGELIVSAYEFGVAHPPGYPIFTITAKLAMLLLPIGSPAWRVNFLNAVYSAAAGGLLQLTVLRLTRCFGSSVLAVGLFSLSRLTWSWSVTAEVFGLNNLFIALLLLLAVTFQSSSDRQHTLKISQRGAFVCGLALCNQHTIVVYVVIIAAWVLASLWKQKILSLRILCKLAGCFLLGLLPYLYLPLSSWLNVARWTWGDQRTLSGFLTHLLRREYGTFDLSKDREGLGFLQGVNAYLDHVHEDTWGVALPLAALGCLVAIHRFSAKRDALLVVFIAMGLLYGTFFAWRANLDTSDHLLKGVVERFWMQSDIIVAVLAAVGCAVPIRWLVRLFQKEEESPVAYSLIVILAGSVFMLQLRNFPFCNQSRNLVVKKFAYNLLGSVPKNAVVFTKGDLPTNSMRYFHLCENIRPDLKILDVEILSYEWSLPMIRKFYPKMKFPGDYWQLHNRQWPDGRTSFNFKALLDANYKKYSVFACIGMQDKDPSWQDTYHVLPHGVCSKVRVRSASFDPIKYANETAELADKWPYESDSFQETSWEKVANDEMWNAKISNAYFLYDQAERSPDQVAKAHYLHSSYELYFRAIKLHQTESRMEHKEFFPTFWHKNFALACERLLQVDHDLDKIELCKLAIYHFQLYADIAPEDKDREAILEAVKILQERLKNFQNLKTADEHLDRFLEKHDGQK